MRLVFHHEIPEDETLKREWNGLVAKMERPEIFYTYEWAAAMQRGYEGKIIPFLALAYEGEKLVGVFSARRGEKQTEAGFLAAATADYCDFVCHPDRRAEFVSVLHRELKTLGIRDMVLANLPADAANTVSLGYAAREHGYSFFTRPAYRCAQIDLSSPEQKETVRDAVARKQVLRRDLKAMSKQGAVELVHLRTWEEISAALPAAEEAHIERFRRHGKVSPLEQEERRRFASELARLLAPQGWMVLSCLTLAGRPVAWNYGFEFNGGYFWYQPAFEESVARYSPGSCLLAKIILEACEREDLHRIDLGLGEEGYKERFATNYRNTMHVTVTSSSSRYMRERVRYGAASVIKSSPRVEHYVRRMLAHWQAGSPA